MEKEKKSTSLRLDKDILEHAESNPSIANLSDWVCDRYRREFMNIESLASKMQAYLDMAESCREQIKILKIEKKSQADFSFLKPRELNWIKNEALNRVEIATFEGVYKAFVNLFDRQDITRRQFRLIIDHLKCGK